MNNILLNVCVAAIITAVFKMLMPDGRNNRQIRLLISCYFIVSIINIFNDNSFFELNDYINIDTEYVDYSLVLKKQTADETANTLRERINQELNEESIFPEKIYIDVNILESSSISISKIRLVFKDIGAIEAERAVELTRKCTGYEIEVKLEEP